MHWFEAAVDKTALDHAFEGADLVGLVLEVHGAVRVVPLTEHAQAFEVGHLDGYLLGGESTAFGLHFVARQVATEFFLDRVFDRQAMAVPSRYVLRVKTFELALLDDHVLQDFVDRVPHVDLAVGIRRAVVQDELGFAFARISQLLVDALVVPLPGPAGFALGQVAAHRKRGFRQIEGVTVIGFFGHDRRAPTGFWPVVWKREISNGTGSTGCFFDQG